MNISFVVVKIFYQNFRSDFLTSITYYDWFSFYAVYVVNRGFYVLFYCNYWP